MASKQIGGGECGVFKGVNEIIEAKQPSKEDIDREKEMLRGLSRDAPESSIDNAARKLAELEARKAVGMATEVQELRDRALIVDDVIAGK